MSSFVEAISLSSITHLAGNPPKYPRNPTEQKRSPLVLYIARVPGSRDVILTTLKPLQKSVTSEDVASSLYYLHLDLPSDDNLLDERDEDGSIRRLPSRGLAIPRKPIQQEPPLKQLVNSERPPQLPPRVPSDQWRAQDQQHFSRKDQNLSLFRLPGESVYRKPLPTLPVSDQSSIPSRPLGPRPNLGLSQISRRAPTGEKAFSSGLNLSQLNSTIPTSSSPTYRTDSNLSSNGAVPLVSDTFSITFIRRDPTSGAQWNIGKIQGHQSQQEGYSSSRERFKRDKPSQTYSVHLDTLGYGQFRGTRVNSNLSVDRETANKIDGQELGGSGFNRLVRMEGSTFWDRSFKIHHRTNSDQSENHFTSRPSKSYDFSTPLAPEGGRFRSTNSTKLQTRGFVFMSPWNGRCEFSTGIGGKSLKCKHKLPNPATAKADVTYSQDSEPVSELRFNLPSGAVFNDRSTSPNKFEGPEISKFSKFHYLRNKFSGSSKSDTESKTPGSSYAAMYPHDDDDQGLYERLDLTLGQEKAGGGTRGTRAKLGKLIVHDEGLKMLDLVVAANMGIWWGIWEK